MLQAHSMGEKSIVQKERGGKKLTLNLPVINGKPAQLIQFTKVENSK